MFIKFILVYDFGHNGPSGQERWCVVLEYRMLKPALVTSLLHLPGSIKINSSLIWVTLTVIPLIRHIATIVVMIYRANWHIMLYNSNHWLFSPNVKSPLGYTSNFAIFLHYSPSAPRSLRKSNPMDGFTFAWGRNNPDSLPKHVFMCTTGPLSPSTVHNRFEWAGPAQLADPLVLTNQVAFPKCVSQCLNVPAPVGFSVVFNNPLYRLIFPEAGAW